MMPSTRYQQSYPTTETLGACRASLGISIETVVRILFKEKSQLKCISGHVAHSRVSHAYVRSQCCKQKKYSCKPMLGANTSPTTEQASRWTVTASSGSSSQEGTVREDGLSNVLFCCTSG